MVDFDLFNDMGYGVSLVHGLIFTTRIILSLCGKASCMENISKIEQKEDNLQLLYSRLGYEHGLDMCDFCTQHYQGVRGHRCSGCKTKLYCGEECRDQDWGVHKLVCRKGEEARKKKGGSKERRQKGSDMLERELAAHRD